MTNRGYPNEVLSSQIYSNISEEGFRKAADAMHELTEGEAEAYARLCASLLEKANVKTDGTVFTRREYEKKKRYGFLRLRSRKTMATEYVRGEPYWELECHHENEERSGRYREEKYILALTVSGKFYEGEIREDYLHSGGYVMVKNEWRECAAYKLDKFVALLDLRLKKHKILMSSGSFWRQLYSQSR